MITDFFEHSSIMFFINNYIKTITKFYHYATTQLIPKAEVIINTH